MSPLTDAPDDVLHRLSRRMPHLAHTISQPDQTLANLGLDSIDLVELLCAIESEFDVRLNDEDLQGDVTIARLVAVIDTRRHKRMPS
jgi:acyl carrier protein